MDNALTLGEAEALAVTYQQKAAALLPLLEQNRILYNRELKILEPENPRTLLAGRLVRWPFIIIEISEKRVLLVRKFSNHVLLQGDACLYWMVGKDIGLAEAENFRNGQIFEEAIRLQTAWYADFMQYQPPVWPPREGTAWKGTLFWYWQFENPNVRWTRGHDEGHIYDRDGNDASECERRRTRG